MIKKIRKTDLMFHSVHGLCRIAEMPKSRSAANGNYSFVPVHRSRSNARFTVAREFVETAGFNKLISAKEAAEILEYFRTGRKKDSDSSNAWGLAVMLREASLSKEPANDKRIARKVNQSAKCLVNELAIVLQSTVRETADRVQQNLEMTAKISPVVVTALSHVDSL